MSTALARLRADLNDAVRSFHDDEEGLEPLAVVMMLALAAVAAVGIYFVGKRIFESSEARIDEMDSTVSEGMTDE